MVDRGDHGPTLYRTFVPAAEHAVSRIPEPYSQPLYLPPSADSLCAQAAKKQLKEFEKSEKAAQKKAEDAEQAAKLAANKALYAWGESVAKKYLKGRWVRTPPPPAATALAGSES